SRGDAVVIRGPDGGEIGRGLIAYDADDAVKIRGKSSGDILLILGFAGRAEMIHRDDLVLGGTWREEAFSWRMIFSENRYPLFGIMRLVAFRRVGPRQGFERGMRPAEVGCLGILADLDDATADRAGAGEQIEQRIAVAPADRASERGYVFVEAAE